METNTQVAPDEVADLLDQVAAANALVHRELMPITGGQLAISQAMLDRLANVIDQTRPAAAARARLGTLSATVLLNGVLAWRARSRPELVAGAR